MSKLVMAEELTTPEAPSAGMAQVYPGADGRLYLMTGDGVAVPILVARAVVAIAAADSPYLVNDADGLVLIDASAGGVNVQLPAGADARAEGYRFKSRNSANVVTILPSGAETIDGASGVTLATYEAVRLAWTGSEWSVL